MFNNGKFISSHWPLRIPVEIPKYASTDFSEFITTTLKEWEELGLIRHCSTVKSRKLRKNNHGFPFKC